MRADHRFHESHPPFCARCGGVFKPEILRPPSGGERTPAHRAAESLGRLFDRIDRDAARAAFEDVLRDGSDIPECAVRGEADEGPDFGFSDRRGEGYHAEHEVTRTAGARSLGACAAGRFIEEDVPFSVNFRTRECPE